MATKQKIGNPLFVGMAAALCILLGYVRSTTSGRRGSAMDEEVEEPPHRDACGFADFDEAVSAGQALNDAKKIIPPAQRIEALRKVADRFPNTTTSRLAESSIENARDEIRRIEEREGYGRVELKEAKLLNGQAQVNALEELLERLPDTEAAIEARVMLEVLKSR